MHEHNYSNKKKTKQKNQVPKYLSKKVCVCVYVCICALSSFVHQQEAFSAHATEKETRKDKREQSSLAATVC